LEVLVASFRGVYKGCELHLILLNLIVFFFPLLSFSCFVIQSAYSIVMINAR
jgi:hypothetical protein